MAAFERATVGLVLWWSANNAFAADPAGVFAMNLLGVAESAERIEADVRLRGLAVVGRTDHSGDARRNGFCIPPIQTVSIDRGEGSAPTRIVVWQAPSGATVSSVGGRPDAELAGAVLPLGLRQATATPEGTQLT